MKKRVLYIGGFELPDRNAASFRVLANASIMKDLGAEVIFRGTTHYANDLKEVYGFKNIPIEYPNNTKKWIRYICDIEDIISIIQLYHINMVLCYNYPSFALKKLIGYCKKNNIKIINECTEWYSSKGLGILKGFVKFWDTLLRIYYIPKCVDYNIVTTKYLSTFIRGKFIIVPEIYIEQYKPDFEENDKDAVQLIYMGNPGLSFNKDNLGMMIEILSEIPENKYQFQVIGITESEYINHLCVNINNYKKIKNYVSFLGRLEHDKCISMLKTSDYVFLYRDVSKISCAGFPRKISESFQYGIPVITTKTSDLHKYVISNKTGYLIPFGKKKAAQYMKRIISKGKNQASVLKDNIVNTKPLICNQFINEFKKMFKELEN